MTDHSRADRVRWSELLNRRYASALVLICLGVWLHAADSLLVATMLPSILLDIGGGQLVAWNVTLYEVGSIVAGAACGLLSLKLGIPRPMIAAASLFACGCFISAAAPAMPVMLIGRALQGLGGGGLAAMSFIAAAVLFPSRLVVRAMAMIAALWGVSSFLGPLFGALFVTHGSWRLGFVFFGIKACLLGAWITFGPTHSRQAAIEQSGPGFPVLRLMLLTLAVLLVAFSGLEVDRVRTPLLLGAGIAVLAGFLAIDGRRQDDRLLPQRVFDIRRPGNIVLALILLLHLATTGLITYGPFLLLTIHGTPALVAGYALACISIGWTVSAIAVSGARPAHDMIYIAAGVTLVAISVPGMLYSVLYGPVWLVFVFAAMEGLGQGGSRSFLVRRAVQLAGDNDRERISGAIPTIARLGYALGAATSGILANAAGFAGNIDADQARRVASFVFLGTLPFAACALIALMALLLIKPTDEPPDTR